MQFALLSIVMTVVMIGNTMDGLNAYAPILLLLKPAALGSATLSLRRIALRRIATRSLVV